MISAGSTITTYAEHGTLETFSIGDIDYTCFSNLDNLDYSRITPCTEFGIAADTWSSNVDDVTMDQSSYNNEISVISGILSDDGDIASMTPYQSGDTLLHAVITFSTEYEWGDSTHWFDRFFKHDFQSVSVHEIGHSLGLDHDSSSSLMKDSRATWDITRTIPTHDIEAVEERF